MKREKHEISELASRFVKNGDIIAVDTGSTAREFIDVFTDKFDELTIVTHSMEIFEKASACRGFNVILCGGYYMKTENSFYGEPALEMLDGFHVSKAFIFPAALSIKNGICDCQPQLAAMQKKIMSVSDEVIVAADSSKYEKSALIKVSDMNPSYTYITDSGISEEIRKIYKDNDIRLITGEKGK